MTYAYIFKMNCTIWNDVNTFGWNYWRNVWSPATMLVTSHVKMYLGKLTSSQLRCKTKMTSFLLSRRCYNVNRHTYYVYVYSYVRMCVCLYILCMLCWKYSQKSCTKGQKTMQIKWDGHDVCQMMIYVK